MLNVFTLSAVMLSVVLLSVLLLNVVMLNVVAPHVSGGFQLEVRERALSGFTWVT